MSRFIESVGRPLVTGDDPLEREYRRAASDEVAERQAQEWIEAGVGETLDDEAW